MTVKLGPRTRYNARWEFKINKVERVRKIELSESAIRQWKADVVTQLNSKLRCCAVGHRARSVLTQNVVEFDELNTE